MENPAKAERDPQAEHDPVLLALPSRCNGVEPPEDESLLEFLQFLETDNCPPAEMALLRQRLQSGPQQLSNLAELSDCKHRLQAMRSEYISARVRAEELELELKQARYDIGVLKKHTRFLQATLDRMLASRAWRLAEKCSRLRQTFVRLLRQGRSLFKVEGVKHVR